MSDDDWRHDRLPKRRKHHTANSHRDQPSTGKANSNRTRALTAVLAVHVPVTIAVGVLHKNTRRAVAVLGCRFLAVVPTHGEGAFYVSSPSAFHAGARQIDGTTIGLRVFLTRAVVAAAVATAAAAAAAVAVIVVAIAAVVLMAGACRTVEIFVCRYDAVEPSNVGELARAEKLPSSAPLASRALMRRPPPHPFQRALRILRRTRLHPS
jgi:hypothetical protein